MTKIAIKKEPAVTKPLTTFDEFAQQMDDVRKRAFELFEMRGGEPGWELEDWVKAEQDVLGWPKAELKEEADTFEMEVSLPGYDPKEIEVTATPEMVEIHAATERHQERKEGERVVWSEFGSNDVYRRIGMPKQINVDAVTAEYRNGLLKVHVPKASPVAERVATPTVAG